MIIYKFNEVLYMLSEDIMILCQWCGNKSTQKSGMTYYAECKSEK